MSTDTAAQAGKIQPRLKQKYTDEIQQKMQDEFGYQNVDADPRPRQGRRQHRCR